MLRAATQQDLDIMLSWRNAPSVRAMMFNEQEISQQEHKEWWQRVSADASKRILIMQHGGTATGVVNFFAINPEEKSCHWGFYMDPSDAVDNQKRLAIWLEIEQQAIDYAFHELGMNNLICETLLNNTHVIQLHKRFGFIVTRQYQQQRQTDTVEVVEMSLQNPAANTQPSSPTMRICFFGSANWDIAARVFADSYQVLSGQHLHYQAIPFGQYRPYIHTPDSPLYQEKPDVCIFCERIEDLLPDLELNGANLAQLEERLENYLQDIRLARKGLHSNFLVFDLFPYSNSLTSLDSSLWQDDGLFSLLTKMNQRLSTLCEELNDCYLVATSQLILQQGQDRVAPGKYWYLGKLPYSQSFYLQLATLLSKWLLSLQEKSVRAIVVDLDNTLWQGVIGDDGLEGIVLGGDFPGNLYTDLQQSLMGLKEQGIMLAICSKNTEAIAIDAINRHPQMRLREEDFVAHRINWQDKADNIQELAREMSLGLGSIMFIDDSPYERAAVQQRLPQLVVPDLPDDPAEWPGFILQHPYLALRHLAAAQGQRGTSLRQRNREMQQAAKHTDKESFWASFESQLAIIPLDNFNRQRIVQLINKTNQFNMTSLRYNGLQLDELIQQGLQVYAINIGDKFAATETAGVLICQREDGKAYTVHNFILSCRYLGRGLEGAIFAWLKHEALRLGYTEVLMYYVPNERNQPALESLLQAGFSRTDNGYSYIINNTDEALAHWVSYKEIPYERDTA
ncbi:MAG: UDP-4-amino-4,6-dideoxy-N-acetyl-beta-L-altrosamine N-acetyltransferase [Gammaproteobacteria bacterium]|nr:UDP-4-amino-4,6-dideoxy-N-acetyl-beta-L-altrosamine N-acetyltransferase [Gammaproteobacteria bacterium]